MNAARRASRPVVIDGDLGEAEERRAEFTWRVRGEGRVGRIGGAEETGG